MKYEISADARCEVWAALMDVSLSFIPWVILWNLQMRLAEKIGVGIAMSLGML